MADLVGVAVGHAAFDAAAEPDRESRTVVIAPCDIVQIPFEGRPSPSLAAPMDDGRIDQAAFLNKLKRTYYFLFACSTIALAYDGVAQVRQAAEVEMFNQATSKWRCLHLLVLFAWLVILVIAFPLLAQQPPGAEVYQDFRGKRSLHPSLELRGQDIDAVTNAEIEGLRITLPGTRRASQPIALVTKFNLDGDFEITGTFELISADQPTKGYGVGVSLSIASDAGREKFAWVSRMMRPGKGSIYASENWDKSIKDSYRFYTKPSEVKIGQLRLVRAGAKLLCLASDGPGKEFIKINEVEQFGSEEMAGGMRFQVINSGSPGSAVDARLVDLRIRYGIPPIKDLVAQPGVLPMLVNSERKPDANDMLAKAITAAPLAAPAPRDPAAEVQNNPPIKGWLAVSLIVGLAVILGVALALFVGLHVRRRRAGKAPRSMLEQEVAATNSVPPSVAFACSSCGKNLKVKTESTGKNVKCPHCGAALHVPEPKGT
jgi:hypothetical protein